jgi:hypothetical protein
MVIVINALSLLFIALAVFVPLSGIAFMPGRDVAGGTLALWLLERNIPDRPWRRT